MTEVWVDTDFGFDDLWALLLLRHYECAVAGISLVAGNAPLPQVVANACGARQAYGLDWPFWKGEGRPLKRAQETATRILGPSGIRSRGRRLPEGATEDVSGDAMNALAAWLRGGCARTVLALGPLTNIARVLQSAPELRAQIARIVWMGGSAGPGNHTPRAEFNAIADPEALALVCASGIPLDIVDLSFCRQVVFGPEDLPDTDALTGDLLGGYLDIALERGRPGMAIYDPLAALALVRPEAVTFSPCHVAVSTDPGDSYGATEVSPAHSSHLRIATDPHADLAQLCLEVLRKDTPHGS